MPKLTDYLLVLKEQDDKSQFLAQAGFTLANPEALISAIRQLTQQTVATLQKSNQYGSYYQVEGILKGPNRQVIGVVTIWLQRADGQVQFVTLKPRKERPNVS
nr:DUF6883 domain-containing protein [Acaryochloris thomasi]